MPLDRSLPSATSDKLPIGGLLALAMTGFIGILTETLPAGLLPQISAGLHVSEALAGQTVTVYAIGSILAAIPLTVATRSWRRRTVLLTAIIGFLLFNTVTALSSNYVLTLIARALAGIAAGLCWSLLASYARRMVLPHQQGRALAIAMVGTPIALSLGVPLGTWLGKLIGWRGTFGGMSVLTLILIAWVLLKVPDFPGQARTQSLPLGRVFTMPGIRPILFVTATWMLAHNILYTYIAPFVVPAGLAQRIDLVLLVFGLFALLGIWIVGSIVDRWMRASTLISLAVFAATALALGIGGTLPTIVYGAVALWGLTFGGAATLLQTSLADAAGANADVAQPMSVTVWNGAIAGGGIVGGLLLESWGVRSFPWVLLILILAGLWMAWASHQHGFKPEPRLTGTPAPCNR
ncbi:MFS transporter [Alcaligenes faecalis]|nr:MFS transporter [Alcaligenes faecalis]MBY6315775.1 MFS transporter [Alcaligenes faecalis]MBY6391018.1 MFS transporter [Alcaligenes faecalis]